MAIRAGWLTGVRQVPSRNFGARPDGFELSLIVIHCIALPPETFGTPYVDDLFISCLDPAAHPYFAALSGQELSSHLFIRRDGQVTQYVSFLDRAWHAGRSVYRGQAECNDYSVGIELEGSVSCAFTAEQYRSLQDVIAQLQRAYPAIGGRIAGHSEIAPGRKDDPGPYFEWRRIRRCPPGTQA